MTNEFLQLRIVRISPETESPDQSAVRSYFLEPLNGQSVSYQAGQFMTLILTHNGHEVRRSYSLSSAPGETLRLTIKRVQNGEISRFLIDTLQVGDTLTSLYPTGRFTLDDTQSGDSTCAARCLSGRVHMTINDVLTERNLADGWVLTCTGYPESDDVVIDV